MKKSKNYRLVHTTCLWSDTLQYRTKKRGKSDRFIPNLICPVNANSHIFREKLSFCNRHLNSHAFPPSHDRPLSSPPHINQSMFPNKLICVTYLLSFDFTICRTGESALKHPLPCQFEYTACLQNVCCSKRSYPCYIVSDNLKWHCGTSYKNT